MKQPDGSLVIPESSLQLDSPKKVKRETQSLTVFT